MTPHLHNLGTPLASTIYQNKFRRYVIVVNVYEIQKKETQYM